MSTQRKLLLLSAIIVIVTSFSSCITWRNPHKKWWKHRTKVTHFNRNNYGGRKLWVKNRY